MLDALVDVFKAHPGEFVFACLLSFGAVLVCIGLFIAFLKEVFSK